MTSRDELLKIADFILNRADSGDLEVIKEALHKRGEGAAKGPQGVNINYMAHSMGNSLAKQVSSSKEYIRETVTNFAVQTIKQHAPEISDEHLKTLLNEWVPDPEVAAKKKENSVSKKKLPPDAELKMIDQFLRFGSGAMPIDEQAKLRSTILDWQEAYWKGFSPKVRGLITLYLKGKIDSETCWREIQKELYGETKE